MNFFAKCLKFVCDLFESDEYHDTNDFHEFTKHTVDKDSITVYAGGELVGAIQSLEYERNLIISDEGPEWTGTISRIRFSAEKLKHVFKRGQPTRNSQETPLVLKWSKGELKGVLLTDWRYTFQAGDWVLVEGLSFTAEDLKEK